MSQPESLTELEPGPLLRAERERQGLSAEQVCTDLNIQPNKLKALEAGEYEKMFSVVFTRGYIRSYARYLGLDSKPLVERFDQLAPAPEQPLPATESLNVKMGGKRSNWLGRIFLVIIILLLWILAYWYFAAQSETQSTASSASVPTANQASPAVAAGNPAVSAPEPEQQLASDEDTQANPYALSFEPDSGAESVRSGAGDLESPSDPAAAAEESAADAPAAELAVPADEVSLQSSGPQNSQPQESGGDNLVLTFAQDCWVRVTDADGVVLLESLQRGGSSADLAGAAPFQIRLGNAQGVSASMNGRTVTVPVSASGNVVNFTVGDNQ
ncbi:RodZ domain-containing protein [Gilvimarinus sp. DA14]|uniref:RodZ domain-containing protein n=1 Tax=Gilvimarinus sp. DA14 TaxID=2956798 RepID=UPI0020B69E80|nr:RodZ domain-containing protein [Gilvimarinus sp. DA14]UTF60865.1 DUF4115 domain-containing protein [Gilvimarinus sp. DA14]